MSFLLCAWGEGEIELVKKITKEMREGKVD